MLQSINFIFGIDFEMSEKITRKNQFQIRKVPLRRFAPEKAPELYALDIHSICLPSKKSLKWASINCEFSKNYEEDSNDRIMYSQAYQLLYGKYCCLKEEKQKEKQSIQQEIDALSQKIEHENKQKTRLANMRDGLYEEIESLREELTECRNKNHNLRWQIYHQRGTYFVNANNYSFLGDEEATYEDLLLLEEQMGNVPKGLNEIELALLPKQPHQGPQQSESKHPESAADRIPSSDERGDDKLYSKDICCICYDDINRGEFVTVLKCKHVHHCDCIKDWLAKQKNCPICKKEVNIEEFRRPRKSEETGGQSIAAEPN